MAREVECNSYVISSLAKALQVRPADRRLLKIFAPGWNLQRDQLADLSTNFPFITDLHCLNIMTYDGSFLKALSEFKQLKVLKINHGAFLRHAKAICDTAKGLEEYESFTEREWGENDMTINKGEDATDFLLKHPKLKSFSLIEWNDSTLQEVGYNKGFGIERVLLYRPVEGQRQLSKEGLTGLSNFQRLKYLSLDVSTLDLECLRKIANSCTHLETVVVFGATNAALYALSDGCNLKEINIPNTNEPLDFFNLVLGWPKLERFLINNLSLDGHRLKRLAEKCTMLQELSCCLKAPVNVEDIRKFLQMQTLVRVKFYGNVPGSFPMLKDELAYWRQRKRVLFG